MRNVCEKRRLSERSCTENGFVDFSFLSKTDNLSSSELAGDAELRDASKDATLQSRKHFPESDIIK